MIRFIVKRQRFDGECLNALKTFYETVDCDAPELEKVLRTGGIGGGPNGDAFDIPELIGCDCDYSRQVGEVAPVSPPEICRICTAPIDKLNSFAVYQRIEGNPPRKQLIAYECHECGGRKGVETDLLSLGKPPRCEHKTLSWALALPRNRVCDDCNTVFHYCEICSHDDQDTWHPRPLCESQPVSTTPEREQTYRQRLELIRKCYGDLFDAEFEEKSTESECTCRFLNIGCDLHDGKRAAESLSAKTPDQLAQQFHEAYERLAPQYGYETRNESAKPWAEVPEVNRRLMRAVCREILAEA